LRYTHGIVAENNENVLPKTPSSTVDPVKVFVREGSPSDRKSAE